ncbi:MAG: hypothetical protein ACK480_13760 [Planctomycetota bacterium]
MSRISGRTKRSCSLGVRFNATLNGLMLRSLQPTCTCSLKALAEMKLSE